MTMNKITAFAAVLALSAPSLSWANGVSLGAGFAEARLQARTFRTEAKVRAEERKVKEAEKAEAAKQEPKKKDAHDYGNCPCDKKGFKAITEKAEAVAAYVKLKRLTESQDTVLSLMAIPALFSPQIYMELQRAHSQYSMDRYKMENERDRAVKLGGLVADGEVFVINLKEGFDYVIDKP